MSTEAEQLDAFIEKLEEEAEAGGYHLNPDEGLTRELAQGLLANADRLGYQCCPCRLGSGIREEDRDIICPCDYRDPDLEEFGQCYCALYVSAAVQRGEAETGPIPERRPAGGAAPAAETGTAAAARELSHPVWRCRVCGYLCARDAPPESCPICKADRDRFERFM